ncbi:MAG: HD domain-containing protein [bacterium]|nr:HD domain-containing protein [bacterium]
MRSLSVKAIKGNEILAKDLIGDGDKILLPAGCKLKIEYREHLLRLGIDSVYIKDEISEGVLNDRISEDAIKEECLMDVKNTLERFSYNADTEESHISGIAEEIINDVLQERNVVYCLAGVRQRSEGIYSHSINVAVLSILIAVNMGVAKSRIKDIAIGSLLHDIGYNGITVKITNEPGQSYTDEEKKEIKKHVLYGYSMISNETWLSKTSKDIILSHHEMINSKGYPFRLDGKHMSLAIKIVSLCNDFDTLVYGRYGKPIKIHDAIAYIIAQSGVRYEHSVVAAFNEVVAAYPNGTLVITNEKDIGIVLRQNQKCPTRPVIRLIQDKSGKRYSSWVEKDLTTCLTLFIEDTLETI